MQRAVQSGEREGWVRPDCPRGPETKGREGGSGSPRALSPSRRLRRPPRPAQDRLSWPAAPGLGRGPKLPGGVKNAAWARPRALEVGQMWLCSRSRGPHLGGGRPVGGSSPTRAHACTHRAVLGAHKHEPDAEPPVPAQLLRCGDRGPRRGGRSCPASLATGGTRQPRGPGRRRGICAPSHAPGALGESLTPGRTSQQGCSATNRMWPASRRHSPRP